MISSLLCLLQRRLGTLPRNRHFPYPSFTPLQFLQEQFLFLPAVGRHSSKWSSFQGVLFGNFVKLLPGQWLRKGCFISMAKSVQTWQYVKCFYWWNYIIRSLYELRERLASMLREAVLPFCSAPVRPHLKYCVTLWGPQHKADMYLMKRGQRRATKTFMGLEHLCHGKRLRDLGFLSLGKSRLWADLIVAF